MSQIFLEKGAWFRAKKYGYGAGWPIKWQGWTLLIAYIAALAGIGLMAEAKDAFFQIFAFALFIVLTAVLLKICHARTEGGWRWRWGE
ncbi:MAG: hypothetical protein HC843_13590 [Sphingomonadales bacterium]|nr:hypothetical protein [Sphingomonadales bacterium]